MKKEPGSNESGKEVPVEEVPHGDELSMEQALSIEEGDKVRDEGTVLIVDQVERAPFIALQQQVIFFASEEGDPQSAQMFCY
jgi:hypothetical protein